MNNKQHDQLCRSIIRWKQFRIFLFLIWKHSFLKHRLAPCGFLHSDIWLHVICRRKSKTFWNFWGIYRSFSFFFRLPCYQRKIKSQAWFVLQKAEMRCLLARSLLDHGFFPRGVRKDEQDDKHKRDQVSSYSWSGQRKIPSYVNKLIFPENFLSTLRTIAMKEDEILKVSALLEEVLVPTTVFLSKLQI